MPPLLALAIGAAVGYIVLAQKKGTSNAFDEVDSGDGGNCRRDELGGQAVRPAVDVVATAGPPTADAKTDTPKTVSQEATDKPVEN